MTLGPQSLCNLLMKFTWEQQKNQAGNIKATFQDTKINLKLFFYHFAICNIRKVQLVNQRLDISYF